MIPEILRWLKSNWLELFSVLSALVYLYFSIRQLIWLWPLGILSSALACWVFFDVSLYADMGLNVYYVLISAYGWWFWTQGNKQAKSHELPVQQSSLQLALWLGAIGLGLYAVILVLLLYVPQQLGFSQASMPILDAFTTAASLIATWMLARKLIEQWLLWIVVDAVAAGMYWYKGLHLYTFLFVVYTIMAAVGYWQWKQSISTQAEYA